ncbi:MAG: HD domain-containing protein [Anaerolineae bacterium]|nr:MAG: HD domain-containing protein [Anaerolineae bacterium]
MLNHRLKILFVEDNPYDVELASHELQRAGYLFDSTRVDTRQDFIGALTSGEWDVVLADFNLPSFHALDALEVIKGMAPDIPLIVVSGSISEEVAVDCMKKGAADYLLKDRLARLGPAVEHALLQRQLAREKLQTEEELRKSEERYRLLVEVAPLPVILYTDNKIEYINPAAATALGLDDPAEMLGKTAWDFVHPEDYPIIAERTDRLHAGERLGPREMRIHRKDGRVRTIEASSTPVSVEGAVSVLTMFRDVTAQKQRQMELEAIMTISDALRAATSPDEMTPVILEQAARLLEARGVGLALLDDAGGEILFTDGMGEYADIRGERQLMEEGVTGTVIRTMQRFVVNDTSRPDELLLNMERTQRTRAAACAPLMDQERAIGALWVGKDTPFEADDLRLLTVICNVAGSAIQRSYLNDEIEGNFIETVLALAKTLDVRDTRTSNHSHNMAAWAEHTAARLGAGADDQRVVRLAALLHDIGKIGVPDEILRKNGPLTPDERAVIQKHPEIGAEIVAPVKKLADVAPIIRGHHEKWDGTGYPRRLKGDDIPLLARVLAVVDAYAAIVEDRVYRAGREPAEALRELERCAGSDFDPAVVSAFADVLKEMGEV